MSATPDNPVRNAANGEGHPQTFWQRLAQSLDRLVVNRSRQAVPAVALRRSKYELRRCRRMLNDSVQTRHEQTAP